MKNSFLVKFAVKLAFIFLRKRVLGWVGAVFFGGPIGFILGYFAEKFLGYIVDQGILAIDLGIMGIKVAIERKEYEKFAEKAYKKAIKKVYDLDEKEKIRQEYIDALSKFGTFSKLSNSSNT